MPFSFVMLYRDFPSQTCDRFYFSPILNWVFTSLLRLVIMEVELSDLGGYFINGCCGIMWDVKGIVVFSNLVNVEQ